MAVLAVSLLGIAACSSSGEVDEADDSQVSASRNLSTNNANTGLAQANPGSGNDRLTQDEIRAQNALGERIFYFDFDIAEFKPADRQTLGHHARDLAANPNKRVRLEGHADERGTREYNLALGERRANSITNYLVVNGASRSQIEVVSYGEERPAASDGNDRAYSQNRRVEIVSR